MHQGWIQLADKVQEMTDKPVNVIAVSRDDNPDAVRKFDVHAYPTIRLYKTPKDFVTYAQKDDGSNLKQQDFLQFLEANNIHVTGKADDPELAAWKQIALDLDE